MLRGRAADTQCPQPTTNPSAFPVHTHCPEAVTVLANKHAPNAPPPNGRDLQLPRVHLNVHATTSGSTLCIRTLFFLAPRPLL